MIRARGLYGLLFVFVAFYGTAQEQIPYTADFEFYEGVYLTFEDFRNNNPLPKEEIISTVDREDPAFYRKLFNTRSFRFFDESGLPVNVFTEDVFGVSVRGEPFIMFGGQFRKIMVLGMLSYFAPGAGDPEVQPRFAYTGEGQSAVLGGDGFKQIIFNFETGEFTDLNPEAVADFIEDSPSLHREFMQLKRKEQRKAMYAFIQRYNKANPIYFPVDR